ncbi:hypothetical protein BT96DRAFT_990402 [Gymnopus androsaceus JB14]|uniref:Uncharacterized protein n=1 Tax=Gymnopus androsaceus JB14 TaxID=1447944 RepID=A0A6A4I3J5_9AGAR|nr:hypothetical protein BT96DRAFT_990402 [Gymnopus androsaceus JB14]
MAHPSRNQTNDLVRAFISAEADEDSISDGEDSNEEMELDLSERKSLQATTIYDLVRIEN